MCGYRDSNPSEKLGKLRSYQARSYPLGINVDSMLKKRKKVLKIYVENILIENVYTGSSRVVEGTSTSPGVPHLMQY